MQILFVVIVLYLIFWIILNLLLNRGKLKFSIFLELKGLDLSILRGPILHPKEMWRYLRFIFNRKLFFHQHISFYMNKAISIIKSMKMLGNSSRGLISTQKHLLYKMHILSITLYNFLLQYYNNALSLYLFKVFKHMQRRAALWILGAFQTFLSIGIEAIAGLISINLHL